ncbi:MAG: endonuclease/exonuclease/phosphatase family protein [Spirochaetia bacterium]|nr:endonuclease/exonuclease/phosphatase family protein [Spirochaetia bacterium]
MSTSIVKKIRWITALLGPLILLLVSCMLTPVSEVPGTGTRKISVMTWNVRFDTPDTPAETLEAKLTHIREAGADIVLLQEVLTIEDKVVREPARFRRLLQKEAEEYGMITAEGASKTGGSNMILYNRERFVPIDQGIRWLSSTPEIPDSTSYGNTIARNFVWAVLYDNNRNRLFTTVTTHLSPESAETNERCAKQLIGFVSDIAGIKIIGGDFNSQRGSTPYQTMINVYRDAVDAGATLATMPVQIDYIFTSSGVTVSDGMAIHAEGLSDHRPVFCAVDW